MNSILELVSYYLSLLINPQICRVCVERLLASKSEPSARLLTLIPSVGSNHPLALVKLDSLLSTNPAYSLYHTRLRGPPPSHEVTQHENQQANQQDQEYMTPEQRQKAIESIVKDISNDTSLDDQEQVQVLTNALSHIQAVYCLPQYVQDRASTETKSDEPLFDKLWVQINIANQAQAQAQGQTETEAQTERDWQKIGFQGKSHPWSDFRKTGMFGLDCLMNFVHLHPTLPKSLIKNAVEQPNWYPFALVSIAVSNFLMSMLQDGSLHNLLLSPVFSTNNNNNTTTAATAISTSFKDDSNNNDPPLSSSSSSPSAAYQALLNIHALLVVHFHSHWSYLQTLEPSSKRPNIMHFETVIFPPWKREVNRWLQRGYLGGWVDSRGWISAEDILRNLVALEQERSRQES